ncbi:MAG: hypothetical protein IJT87_09395 [Ruminiclostridium sp.]|nr:hypothetical protein [Ruminiclostridium sp.]
MDNKKIDIDRLYEEFEEDEEEYGYEDYEEYIEDDIYGDHGEYDDDLEEFDEFYDAPMKVYEPPKKPERSEQPEQPAPAAEPSGEQAKPVDTAQLPMFSDEPPKGDLTTKLDVPKPVMEILDLLKAHTYTSYLVGDCVNMMVLGERVMDFDIACNASLDRIIAIFDEKFKTREDLLSRGELIIINGAMGISVAPYRSRIDGSGKPIYCKTIDEDLHRRTFTSEAVAYNPDSGIYDCFKGLSCITAEKTILRAIDEEKYEQLEFEQSKIKSKKETPQKVVIEALRENPECILIAMQKHARAEADMSPYTLRNINDNAELIDMMMPSEITRYFRRIILGRRITETLMSFREVVFRIFPPLRPQYGFDQKSEYQEYTLYEHTVKAVGYAFPDYAVRLALLLHSIGKPDCAADRGDYMTFYGHQERGVMLAKDIFEDDYEADRSLIDRILFLILHHDDHVTPENVVDFTSFCGMELTRLLLLLQSANVRAKSSDPVNERVSTTLRQLADNVATLAVNPRATTRRAATQQELREINERLGRTGV